MKRKFILLIIILFLLINIMFMPISFGASNNNSNGILSAILKIFIGGAQIAYTGWVLCHLSIISIKYFVSAAQSPQLKAEVKHEAVHAFIKYTIGYVLLFLFAYATNGFINNTP